MLVVFFFVCVFHHACPDPLAIQPRLFQFCVFQIYPLHAIYAVHCDCHKVIKPSNVEVQVTQLIEVH